MSDNTSSSTIDSTGKHPVGDRPITGAGLILELMNALLATGSVAMFMLWQFEILNKELHSLAQMFDNAICLWFASQATWNLWRSPNRRRWWRWGWADYLASIPFLDPLRFLRWVRLLLIIRAVRSTVRSVHGITILFSVGRVQSVLALVFSLIVVSVIISSFIVLGFESIERTAAEITGGTTNAPTPTDALLWSLATMLGADPSGFGDFRPTTLGARIVNLWLVIVSLGLIGSLAGLISAWIEEEPDPEKLRERR